MASVNKLSIRGVRAFSPEDSEQVVEFYFPLTIILGKNGCGKTTIIESLKYAITGSFPPGMGKSGQAFVHDPQSIGLTVVKANVKLRFNSRASQQMVVVRSMEVTQKKTKATFKQLDGVIRTTDPDTGKRVALSHKCSELDKEVPQLFGVSKAILDNVVFCHQEDASWPLMEGAVLKKRFDDIFDSTKYSKALKVLRDQEKELNLRAKDLKAEVAGLSSHLHAAKGFRKELEEQTDSLDAVKEKKMEIETELETAESKKAELQAVFQKLDEIGNEISELENEMDRERSVVEKSRSMLEQDLTSKGLAVLKEDLRDFHQKMSSQVSEKEELEGQCEQINRDIAAANKEVNDWNSRVGKRMAEKEAHEKNLKERYRKMEKIASKFEMDLTQVSQSSQMNASFATLSQMDADDETVGDSTLMSITAEDMEGFFAALMSKEDDLAGALKDERDRIRDEEDRLTSALTEIGGKLQAIENDKNRLSDEKRDAEQELQELKAAAGPSRIRRTDVEDHKRRAAKAASERDELNNNPLRGNIQLDIRQAEEDMDALKRKIEDETIVLNGLKHTAEAQSAVVALQEQCAKELDNLEENLREENYQLSKYKVATPEQLPRDDDERGEEVLKVFETMYESACERYNSGNSQLRLSTEEATASQKTVSQKTALLDSNLKTLNSLKSQLQAAESSVTKVKSIVEKLRDHEGGLKKRLPATASEENPKEILQYLDDRLKKLEEDAPSQDAPKIAKKVVKRLKKMAVEDQARMFCPCCTREMNFDEVDVFVATMETFKNDPTALLKQDIPVGDTEKLKATYQKFRNSVEENLDTLRDYHRVAGEIANLEKEAKKLTDEFQRFSCMLKDQNSEKERAQSEVNELRDLMETVKRMSNDASRIQERKMQIHLKKEDLSASVMDSSRDLKTVEREITDLRDKKDTLASKINRWNKEITDINRRISEFSSRASNLEKLAREKEEKFATELKQIDRKKELTARVQQIGEEETKLSDRIAPLQQRKRQKEKERHRMRSHGQDEEQDLQTKLNSFKNEVSDLRRISKEIEAYEMSDGPRELERFSDTLKKIEKRIEDRKRDLLNIEPSLEQVRKAVDDQERHKKHLKENIEILQAGDRIEELEKQIEKLQAKRKSIDNSEEVESEFQSVAAEIERLKEQKAQREGQFSTHGEQIRALKRKLKSEEYRNVDEQYRVARIKETTTKMASADLKQYAAALDKIAEINKIIRELWMMTYKGQDISNIEIQSGMEPGSKAAKSYNYRVVMTKGGAKLDMRGRCSAGQRVLGSIVIRLALAETFGLNCGVIALDEPTVNLDYNNKKGLAVSLAHIIASRAQQRNFQLILITHDEEFVNMMKTELSSLTGFSMPEKFFRVCREEAADGKFYSKINAVDWDELL